MPKQHNSLAPLTLVGFIAIVIVGAATAIFSQRVAAHAGEEPDTQDLKIGLPTYRSASGNQSHRFRITVDGGYLVRFLFTKQDLNLMVTVHAPDGRVLSEYISRRYGPAEFSFIAEASGEQMVEVQSLEEGHETREYKLEVINVTQARPIDTRLNTSEKDFAEAEKLAATWGKDDLKAAIRLYLRAARDWQSAGHPRQAATGFGRAGELCFILSDYSKAIDNYEKAFAASLAGSNRLAAADALNGIGYALVYEGENSKAMPYFQRSLRIARQLESVLPVDAKRLMAQALNNMGEVHYSLSDPDKTLDEFNRAFALWQEVGDRQGQATAEINLGYLHLDLGNMREAVAHYANALQLFRAIKNRSGEASVITAIGGIHSFQGEKQEAIDSHNRALGIFRSIGDRRGEAAALNGLGQAYKSLNDPATALGHYTRALDLYREIGHRDYEGLDALYVGSTYRLNGDMTMALKFCKQSVELSRQVGDKRIEVYALRELALIYNSASQGLEEARHLRKALHTYSEIEAGYQNIKDKRGQAYSLLEMGRIWERLNQPNKSLGYYRQALSRAKDAQDVAGQNLILYALAHAEQKRHRFADALGWIEKSIKSIESLRTKVLSRDLRASYFASVYEHYSLYIDTLMQLHNRHPNQQLVDAALEASEKARGRSLLDVLMNAEIVEQERTLDKQSNGGREGQGEAQRGSGTAVATEIQSRGNENTSAHEHQQFSSEEKELRSITLAQAQPLTLSAIEAELKDDNTVLLQFFLGDERSYVWAVTRSQATAHQLPGRDTIEKAVREYYSLMTAWEKLPDEMPLQYRQRVAEADRLLPQQAAVLSRMLLGPVSEGLRKRRLLIAPDRSLYFLPFETLPDPNDAPNADEAYVGKALLYDHEVVIQPSVSILAAIRRERALRTSAPKMMALLADPVFDADDDRVTKRTGQPSKDPHNDETVSTTLSPSIHGANHRLPFSLREARRITEIAGESDTLVASGFDANVRMATDPRLGLYRIVHLATHGSVNVENPALSGIMLSLVDETGNSQQGFLGLYDIYNLHLNADLVVLSACRTALGKDVRGEGLVGLTRGFLYAGSSSVVASLWQVDDEATAALMTHFYTALLRDRLSPAVALNLAKQAMRSEERWRAPYYWAGFTLQGEYEYVIWPRESASARLGRRSLELVAGVIALSVMVVLFLRSRRKSPAR